MKLFSQDIRIEYRMNKFRFFLVCTLFFTTGFASAVFVAQEKPEVIIPDVMVAFDQALKEVEKGCPMLLEYAQMLEQENARLNRTMKTMIIKDD